MKFAVVLAVLAVGVYGMPQKVAQLELDTIMNQVDRMSLAAESSDDTTSMECLNYYYPILQQIQAEANATITVCDNVATTARAAALTNITAEKAQIDSITGTVSTNLVDCKAETNPVQALECYAVQGGVSADEATQISNEAQDDLRNYNQQMEVINATCTNCNAVATEKAAEESSKVYSALNLCMNYGSTYNPLATTIVTVETPTVITTDGVSGSTANPNQPPSGK
ncbi:hypothetical protein ACFFRR_007524 [Megaselia abdita]